MIMVVHSNILLGYQGHGLHVPGEIIPSQSQVHAFLAAGHGKEEGHAMEYHPRGQLSYTFFQWHRRVTAQQGMGKTQLDSCFMDAHIGSYNRKLFQMKAHNWVNP